MPTHTQVPQTLPFQMPKVETTMAPQQPQPREAGPTWTYGDLEAGLRKAHAAGDTENAAQFAEAIRSGNYKESQNDLVSMGLGFSQGATLGGGDEAAAAIRAAIEHKIDPYMYALGQKFLGGEEGYIGESSLGEGKTFGELVDEREEMFWSGTTFGERYDAAKESGRRMLETARREDPALTFAGEMAGGVGLTAAPAAAIVRGSSTMLRGFGKLTAAGTAEGGAAGYGYSEGDPVQAALDDDISEDEYAAEAQQAAVDTGIGLSIGGGTSVLLPLSATIARSVGRLLAKPFTKDVRLKEEARQKVAAAIAEDLEAGGITLRQAQDEIDNAPGLIVADLGAAMRELTETTAQMPYKGGRQLREFLEGRNKEQWSRMYPRLSFALTGNSKDTFAKAQRDLLVNMKRDANEAYGAIENDIVRMTPEMLTLMRLKPFKPALKNANDLRYLENMGPLAKKLKAGDQLTVKEMDQIVRGMDDVVTDAWKNRPAVAKALTEKRNEFRELLYDQSDGLRQARKAWAGDKLNEEAMAAGEKILREDADIAVEMVQAMSKSERINFKIGALRAIARRLGGKSDAADLTKGIFDRPNVRDAVRVAFGSKKKFNDFMDYVTSEQKRFDTFAKANLNSSTARRLAQQETQMGGKLAALFGYGAAMSTGMGLPPSIGGYLSRKGYEAAVPKGGAAQHANAMAQNQADMLMSGNLQSLMRPNTVGGLLDTGIPTTGAIGTGGLLATDPMHPEY